MIVSEKPGPHGMLLVVTDEEILGKKFEEGKVQLDLTQEFYQGIAKTKEEIKKIIPQSRHLHLTGKQAVALAVELNLIESPKILFVQGIPHAEIVMGD
jgi:uncharacterized protein